MKKLTLLLAILFMALSAQAIVLDKGGLGNWRIGGSIKSFPSQYSGLYTSFTKDYEACQGVYFYDCSNGRTSTLAAYFENMRFTGFAVFVPSAISVRVNGRTIKGDSPVEVLFALSGVEAYYVYWDGIGVYVGGITFYFSDASLSAAGKRKMKSAGPDGIKLRKTDFLPGARPVRVTCGEIPTC